MAEQTLKERTAKGLFWGGISNGVQQLLSLIFGLILARILGANDYGMVGMLAIFPAIAATLQDSGFSVALINKEKIDDDDYNAVFWFNVIVSLLLYIILFFLAPYIADFYHKPELCSLARFSFLGFVFSSLGIAHNAILLKKLMIKEKAKIDIGALLISGCVGLFFVLRGYGFWGLAIQNTAYIGVGTILRWFYSPWKPSFHIDFYPLKNMFGFSIKLFFTNIFSQINSNIFSVLLGRFYDPAQVGYYSQGYKWMTMGHGFVGGIMNGVAHPVLVEAGTSNEYKRKAFRKMLRFGAFISFPLILGLGFVGKEFIYVAIGEKWLPSVPFLQLFCIWGAFIYIWNLYIALLMSLGKSDLYMWGVIGIGSFQLIFVALMFHFGIYPMVISYISISFLGIIFWQYCVKKVIGLSFGKVICDILPYLSVSLFSFMISWLLTLCIDNMYYKFILKILISSIVYLSLLWLFKSVILKEVMIFIMEKFHNAKMLS